MLNAFLLLTALSVSDMSNTDLEKYYWDCDTSFMQGSLGGQDMKSCLQITEQFQKLMFNSDPVMLSWTIGTATKTRSGKDAATFNSDEFARLKPAPGAAGSSLFF